MPHVVLEEAIDLPVASQGITLAAVRNGSEILKVVDVYVRLLPATAPEKAVGVKRLMGLIAVQLHESAPGSRFGKTNLQEFLP